MRLYFLPALLLAGHVVSAQDMKNKTPIQVKVYNVFSNSSFITKTQNYFYKPSGEMPANIWSPSIAVAIPSGKRSYHEIELSNIGVKKHTSEPFSQIWWYGQPYWGKMIQATIMLRYEYILNLTKRRDAKFVPAVGIAAATYYAQNNFKPYVTSSYPSKDMYIGLKMFVTPRLNYNLSKRVFFDLNVPICLTDLGINTFKQYNPTAPNGQSTTSNIEFTTLPNYLSARLGIGLKI